MLTDIVSHSDQILSQSRSSPTILVKPDDPREAIPIKPDDPRQARQSRSRPTIPVMPNLPRQTRPTCRTRQSRSSPEIPEHPRQSRTRPFSPNIPFKVHDPITCPSRLNVSFKPKSLNMPFKSEHPINVRRYPKHALHAVPPCPSQNILTPILNNP